jgi:hypothetical protein
MNYNINNLNCLLFLVENGLAVVIQDVAAINSLWTWIAYPDAYPDDYPNEIQRFLLEGALGDAKNSIA